MGGVVCSLIYIYIYLEVYAIPPTPFVHGILFACERAFATGPYFFQPAGW